MDTTTSFKKNLGFSLRSYFKPAVFVFAGLALLAGCGTNNSVDEVDFLVPVSVSDVETASVEDHIVATGTLRASEMVFLEVETAGILKFATNSQGTTIQRRGPGQGRRYHRQNYR